MDLAILGWPDDGPTLDLDHERFAYAGKFVMSNTGKAVARVDGDVVAAVAFNADRTDAGTCWFRYVTVRANRRGEGIGPRLLAFTRDAVTAREFEACKIAVNNPFAYEACYRAGFGFTGEETGLAELVLRWPPEPVESGTDGAAEASPESGTGAAAETTGATIDGDAGADRAVSYRAGLDRFVARTESGADDRPALTAAEADFVAAARERGPPSPLDRGANDDR